MAEPTEDVVNEPPSTGASGRLESPSLTVTSCNGTPSISAAIWAIMVYVPGPISAVALAISTLPLAVITARALAFNCIASQMPLAIPQPTSSLPSRMERGSGVRLDQPNFSAPCR